MDYYLYLISKPQLVFFVFSFSTLVAGVLVFRSKKVDLKPTRRKYRTCSTCEGSGRLNESTSSDTRIIDGIPEPISYDRFDVCSACNGKGGFRIYSHNTYTFSMICLKTLLIMFALWGLARWLPRDWFGNEIVNHYGVVSVIVFIGFLGLIELGEGIHDRNFGLFLLSIIAIVMSVFLIHHIFSVVAGFYYLVSFIIPYLVYKLIKAVEQMSAH